jgi:hypothetical protein
LIVLQEQRSPRRIEDANEADETAELYMEARREDSGNVQGKLRLYEHGRQEQQTRGIADVTRKACEEEGARLGARVGIGRMDWT